MEKYVDDLCMFWQREASRKAIEKVAAEEAEAVAEAAKAPKPSKEYTEARLQVSLMSYSRKKHR